MSKRLDEMPHTGKIAVGSNEEATKKIAEEEGIDYFLHFIPPPNQVYIMDLDLILSPMSPEEFFGL